MDRVIKLSLSVPFAWQQTLKYYFLSKLLFKKTIFTSEGWLFFLFVWWKSGHLQERNNICIVTPCCTVQLRNRMIDCIAWKTNWHMLSTTLGYRITMLSICCLIFSRYGAEYPSRWQLCVTPHTRTTELFDMRHFTFVSHPKHCSRSIGFC